MHTSDSDELCRIIAERCDGTVILSFSGGKDSLAAWLKLRRFFKRILPVYMYLIPDLRFVERGLVQYERYFDTHIIRMPHPSLYRQLNNFTLQPPEHLATIEAFNPINYDNDDLFDIVKVAYGLPLETYVAIGVRATDSLNRWASVKKYGASNEKRHTFFPIYDYRKDQLLGELREAGIRLPAEYRYFYRSFDGLDWRFLKPMKEHYPDDYQRVLDWFPLAELELKRIEYREAYYGRLSAGSE